MSISLDESIGMLTNQTNKKMIRHLNTTLEKYNITLEQWNVLLKLSLNDKLTQKQLAESVDKDQPTLARILDILERKKLIERLSNSEDRRSFLVHITDSGAKLIEEVAPYIEGIFKKMLKGISIEKINIFIQVLTAINWNIANCYEEEH